MRMKEKVVLITGATGEIGTAMTQRFLAEGLQYALLAGQPKKLADVNESLGAGAKLTTCLVDALDEAAVLSSVERCVANWRRIVRSSQTRVQRGKSASGNVFSRGNSTKPFLLTLQAYGCT